MKAIDRNLLTLAGKASGKYFDPTVKHKFGLLVTKDDATDQYDQVIWNPLTHDSDTARMETYLKLEVRWHEDGVEVGCRDKPFSVFCFFAEHNNDESAARRRASTEMASKL